MLPRPWTRLALWEIWPRFPSFCRSEIYYSCTLRSIAILSLSLIVPRSDNPQITSAVRVISCLLNGKIRCRSRVCKCICGSHDVVVNRSNIKEPDGANSSARKSFVEIFSKLRAVGLVRLFEFHRPHMRTSSDSKFGQATCRWN
ncbi:hypothetical protein AVEN_143921-1 [Araneus ventricosus]|uniref:Uncharacterized protein n=1 Tax=Araneus ventricosus TaxID=182803 RepID=A0A4Y2U750_ARAVE|nr:hypothetical protein AVEN_143921-1 [Araneus ventricosus]